MFLSPSSYAWRKVLQGRSRSIKGGKAAMTWFSRGGVQFLLDFLNFCLSLIRNNFVFIFQALKAEASERLPMLSAFSWWSEGTRHSSAAWEFPMKPPLQDCTEGKSRDSPNTDGDYRFRGGRTKSTEDCYSNGHALNALYYRASGACDVQRALWWCDLNL